MAPTIAEIVFWLTICIIGWGSVALGALMNPEYDPKGDDPYRYCPKEDEQ